MKRALAITALSVLALGSAAFAAVESGLKPGTPTTAFQVVDVTGPNKGKQLCYRCAYGNSPVIAAFIKGNAEHADQLVAAIQKLTQKNEAKGLHSFVVFMGGPELKPTIEKIAAEKKITIPVTFLPQGTSAEDVAAYKISPDAKCTVLLWNQSKVRGNFVDVTKEQWTQVAQATEAMLK